MDIIKDFIMVNKESLNKSIKSLIKNWPIIFTGIVYMTINIFMISFVITVFRGILSIFAGIFVAIVSSSLISNYFYLLFNIINYDRITLQDFKVGFKYFLRKVYMIFFLAWLGSFVLDSISKLMGFNYYILNLIITFSVLILLNALPETLYQKALEPVDSITYSFDFIKENWFNWFIPNAIFYVILYLVTGQVITDIFATHINFRLSLDMMDIIKYLAGQVIFSFIMIYRGYLYKILSTSTRRKRMFMNRF
ncbi:MAG TPA: hypothetical protein VIK77_13510 [Tissierellaceae bacterium]